MTKFLTLTATMMTQAIERLEVKGNTPHADGTWHVLVTDGTRIAPGTVIPHNVTIIFKRQDVPYDGA